MNNVTRLPEDLEHRHFIASVELTEARTRLVRLAHAVWTIVSLVIIICAPAVVIAAWRWAL